MCSGGWVNVFSFGVNVFSFWPDVFTFRPNVFTLAGQVFSFRWRALVGDRGRREGEIRSFGKLRTGFDRVSADGESERWWARDGGEVGAGLVRWDRSGRRVPLLRQAQDRLRQAQGRPLRQAEGRFFGDGGMTGMCPLCQANVSSFWPDVSTFRPNVSSFRPNVFGEEGESREERAGRGRSGEGVTGTGVGLGGVGGRTGAGDGGCWQ